MTKKKYPTKSIIHMKSFLKNNANIEKYKFLGYLFIIVAITYVLSDLIEWYIYKDRYIFDLNQMPFYRRLITDFYLVVFGYAGYLIIKNNNRSWVLVIISMTSIIPSFIIIPLVWNVSFYTNWLEDFPFLLWYLFSLIVIIVFISNRKHFGINNWVVKLLLITFINIIIRVLHEVIMFKISNF